MKTIFSILLCLSFLTIQAQEHNTLNHIKHDTIFVRGNCEMCKSNIENAVNSIVTAKGTWDVNSKVLTFSYDPKETSDKKILQSVAEAGYDNERYTADEEDYKKLDACCQYD
ncbi:MAG: heavy-metal-associated domain-containing protein, partial [Weeksellaceae bacterium]